jgi:hypothetical protein
MNSKLFIKQLALASCALLAVTLTARAQLLSGSDTGSTAPTPGFYDISQLLTTGDTVVLPDGSGLNDFYDNTSGGTGYVGSSFTTGPNSTGYTMTSFAFKFGGGNGGTGGVPNGYAGGNDVTLAGGWIITIYKLSGTGNTNATPVATNTVGTLTGAGNTGHDWIQVTGITNVSLSGNSTYAWTIFQPSGYDDLAYATGTPFTGGAICRIPPAGGLVTFFSTDADSATFDIGLEQNSPVLGGTDFGATAPPVGIHDIAQLLTTGDTTALPDSANLNDFYDNTTATGNGGGGYVGSSFTTGANVGGYVMNGLVLKFGGGGGSGSPGYSGGNDATLTPGWIITIYQLSGTGNTNATPISTNTVGTLAGTSNTGGDWIQLTGFDLPLAGNTTYAWTIFQPSGYDDLGYATGTPYSGGAICRIPPGGGAVKYFPADADSATFAVNVSLTGYPAVGIISATPNPIYALSPLTLTNSVNSPGPYTNQWQTNTDFSGALGGTWVNVPGANGLSLTTIPPNLGAYIIDFQFIASNAVGSVTSAVAAVTVNPASAPIINTDITPTQITTYVGGSASFNATFTGTLPLTNDWQGATNGSMTYVDLTGQTNATLNLTNVQLTSAGTYQLLEKNSQGNTPSSAATLTVLADPPAPTSSQKEAFQIYSEAPYAYWRLNETANPSSGSVEAYDYSGHGFYATYGIACTDDNPGPGSSTYPGFPGFASTELSAGTTPGTGGNLSVPPLNLNTNTVTFVAWIYPNGNQNGAAGLLFDRNGGDAAGFGFGSPISSGTMPQLGYTWNQNAGATYGWASGLVPPANQWSFVAYVITPTNATAYLGLSATTNLLLAVNPITHNNEAFTNASELGGDPQSLNRTFYGYITEAALWNVSLNENQVLSLFLTGLGSSGIAPVPPSVLPNKNAFTGSTVQYSGTATGSPTITYQWKSAVHGSGVFTNVPNSGDYSGANTGTLTISSLKTNDARDYEVVAANSIGTNTSGVGTLTVTVVPPGGQWAVNFQVTNDTISFATSTSGGGQYTGNGVLGSGNYWNTFVNTAGAFGNGTFNTATDFRDDGVTHSGIFASVNGSDDSTLGSTPPSTNISALIQQFVYGTTTLTFTGVPDGIYNLVIYGIDGAFANGGDILTVNATNGTQMATTSFLQTLFFEQNDNATLFTNVEVDGGTLVVNVAGNTAADQAGTYYNASFNGAQLQLISYDTSITNIQLSQVYSAANKTITLTWPEGVLQTTTNLTSAWTDIVSTSPITVSATNKAQFFRLKVE